MRDEEIKFARALVAALYLSEHVDADLVGVLCKVGGIASAVRYLMHAHAYYHGRA